MICFKLLNMYSNGNINQFFMICTVLVVLKCHGTPIWHGHVNLMFIGWPSYVCLSLYLDGRRDAQITLQQLSMSLATLKESLDPILFHSLLLYSYLLFCPFLLLVPFSIPCKIVFAIPEDLEMHSKFCILDSVANLLNRHMIFGGNVQKSPIASHLNGLDHDFKFCCQSPALTGIKEDR